LFSVLKETPRPSKEIYVALSVKGVTDSWRVTRTDIIAFYFIILVSNIFIRNDWWRTTVIELSLVYRRL
jgi:hypothetical protein